MATVEVEVRNPVNSTTLRSATAMAAATGIRWRDVINDVGSGELTVPVDDAAVADLGYGNLVRCLIGGTVRYAWVIEARDTVTLASGEEADEGVTVSGRGALALLEDTLVYPSGGIGQRPLTDDRLFGFMSADYADSGWASATAQITQGDPATPWPGVGGGPDHAPAGWPDPSASWIWAPGASSAGTSKPVGHVYFRHTFVAAGAMRAAVYASADDLFTVWLDGVPLLGVEDEPYAWTITKRAVVDIDAGAHTLAAVVENIGGIAGFLCSVWETDTTGTHVANVDRTSAAWKSVGYPADPPGMTVGAILGLLLNEAGLRDANLGWAASFGPTLDSAGVAWDEIPTWAAPVGRTLLERIQALVAAGYVDVTVDVDPVGGGLQLLAYRPGTLAPGPGGVTIPATSLEELSYQGRG